MSDTPAADPTEAPTKAKRAPHKQFAGELLGAFKYGGLEGLVKAVENVGKAKAKRTLLKMAVGSPQVAELVAQMFGKSTGRPVGSLGESYIVDKKGIVRINVSARGAAKTGEHATPRVIKAGEIEGLERDAILLTFS